jgi:curved DNA-binding protein CbpA
MDTGASAGTYYEILGLEPGCSLDEIKRSFRARAKRMHPDMPGAETGGGTEAMRVLIKAYRVLGDPRRREDYDRSLGFDLPRQRKPVFRFNYREFLRLQRSNEGYSRLIFFDLFHNSEKEALDLYDFLVSRYNYEIADYLDREDFMDCAFLLAEEYEKRVEPLKAFHLLTLLMEYEQEQPYFRHFTEEVLARLKFLANMRHAGSDTRSALLDCIVRLLQLDILSRESAFFFRKAAELAWDLENHEAAREYLARGLDLDRKQPGFKKLQQKMRFCHTA